MQLSMSQIIECYLHATQNEIDIDKSLSKALQNATTSRDK